MADGAVRRRGSLGVVPLLLPWRVRRSFGLWAALALALLCLLCSANVLDGELVAGDVQFIVENETLRRPSVLVTAFTHGYWWVGSGSETGTYYRPLVVLLDALDYRLWGGRPLGYHLTNTLLYAVASVLVFVLGRAVSRSAFAALGAAVLFAAHPIHVYATSYISARSTLLCTAFYVGALIAAVRFRRDAEDGRVRGRSLLVALACYVGALLTLEAAVTLPIALAVVLWPPRDRRGASVAPLLRFGLAVVALSAAYLVIRRLALGGVLSHKQALWELLPPLAAALTMAKTLAYYLVKLVVPTDLSYVPPFLPVLDARDLTGWASAALVAAAAGFTLCGPARLARERAALGLFLMTLLPVSGIVPLDHFVKGHYAFLPSVGLALLAALLLRRALRAASKARARGAALGALGLALGILTATEVLGSLIANEGWQSAEALNARVLELEPQIPDELFPLPVMTPTANRFAFVHFNVATVLARDRRCAEALPHVRRTHWLTRQRSMKLRATELEAYCVTSTGAFPGLQPREAP